MVFKTSHRRCTSGGSSIGDNDQKGVNLPSKCLNVMNKWLVFFNFNINGFLGESIISIFEFNKLDYEIRINVVWWRGFVQKSFDAKDVGFKASITMTSLCTTCAWMKP